MQINVILFYFFCIVCRSIVNSTLSHINSVADLKRCKYIHMNRWHERTFMKHSIATKNNFTLEFYVIGSGGCLIDLSPTNLTNRNQTAYHLRMENHEHSLVFTLLIGGWNNTRTHVRRDSTLLRSVEIKKVLSDRDPVRINIEISCLGEIQIYRHGESLMKTIDRNSTIDVHYFRFGTDNPEHMGFYDCFYDNAEIISHSPIEIQNSRIGPNDNAVIMSSANKRRTFSPIMALFVALFCFL